MMAVGIWLKSDPDVTEYLEIVDGDTGMRTIHGVGLSMMIIGCAIFLCGTDIFFSYQGPTRIGKRI